MFERVGKPIADSIFEGINGTIFAYGQTGSGKTFTIMGPDDTYSHPTQGIAPRVLRYVFEQIKERDMTRYSCTCSFLEIYNETIQDLISGKQRLVPREDTSQRVYVKGLTETPVSSALECLRLLSKGLENRSVAATAANEKSSRSHSVLTLSLEFDVVDAKGVLRQKRARLNLVDLAGSERQSKAKTSGQQFKEACAINQSLSHLGLVINAIAQKKGSRAHVNYRSSKLTFLLRDSLGGSSRTFIIATVSPSAGCFGETMSTLQFATRAKEIKNVVSVNESTSPDAEILRLTEANKQLQLQLQLTLERVDELEQANIQQPDELQLEAFCARCRSAPTEDCESSTLESIASSSTTTTSTPAKSQQLLVPSSPIRCSSPMCKTSSSSPRPWSDAERLAMVVRCVESDSSHAKRQKQLEDKYQVLLNYVSGLENTNELLQMRLKAIAKNPADTAEFLEGEGVLSFLNEGESLREDSQLLDCPVPARGPLPPLEQYGQYTQAQLLSEVLSLRGMIDSDIEFRRLEVRNRALQARVDELEALQLGDKLEENNDQIEQLRVLNRELLRQVRSSGGTPSKPGRMGSSTPTRGLVSRSSQLRGSDRGSDELQLQHKLAQSTEEIERLRSLNTEFRTQLEVAAQKDEANRRKLRGMKEHISHLETGDEALIRRHFEEQLDRELAAQTERYDVCASALADAQKECTRLKSCLKQVKTDALKQIDTQDNAPDVLVSTASVENIQPNDVARKASNAVPLRRALLPS